MNIVYVITVCHNAVLSLEETILSVLGQTYPNVRYLIIDGASTDGTVEIIKKYQDRLAYWISEPDMGIYDAMNKGLRMADQIQGVSNDYDVWVNFMNAGDSFFDNNVLSDFFDDNVYASGIKILGGHICNHYKEELEIHYAESPDVIPYRIPICHQTAFTRLRLNNATNSAFQFNLKYKFAADYDLYYQVFYSFEEVHSFKVIDRIVANCSQDDSTTFKNLYIIKGEYLSIQSAYRSWRWWKEYIKWKLVSVQN